MQWEGWSRAAIWPHPEERAPARVSKDEKEAFIHGSRRRGVYHRAALRADPLAAPHHEAAYNFDRVTASPSSFTNDPAGLWSRSSTASDGRQSRTAFSGASSAVGPDRMRQCCDRTIERELVHFCAQLVSLRCWLFSWLVHTRIPRSGRHPKARRVRDVHCSNHLLKTTSTTACRPRLNGR